MAGVPGFIPEFYIMAACNKANYRYYGDWQQLEGNQRAKIIAHYLLDRMIDSHTADAEARAAEKASK